MYLCGRNDIQPRNSAAPQGLTPVAAGNTRWSKMVGRWIDNSNHSNRNMLIQNWLNAINYQDVAAINQTHVASDSLYDVYSLDGKKLLIKARSLEGLKKGAYIINGEKRIIE